MPLRFTFLLRPHRAVPLAALVLAAVVAAPQRAAAQQASSAQLDATVLQGIAYLGNKAQADDGSFSGQAGPAVTALCVSAILKNRPQAISDPVVRKAMDYLEKHRHSDGGIYAPGSKHRNYETAVAVTAFRLTNQDGKYDETLAGADRFLRGLQWDEGEGIEPSDTAYGGAGYGSHNRPDLSNTSFMIEALRELGADEDDPAIQKALIFVSRTQNLESPANDTPFAALIDDGGFYYTPAAGGQSQANQTANGGLRSYGSMTYAGLKSLIYAGVEKDDPRVKAAMDFIRAHYSLESNPGMGAAGLYYYYHTFAKALDVAEVETLKDAEGQAHDWKQELTAVLAEKQQPDGSWVNEENKRWMEGDASLVTAYALLALSYCK
ncbi:prenyltransferase/squalene oxidase repeat-containing protein [Roseimaritima sediminicola]|uniref:prenyltransferase/squalene oxidase repeat-containing protein n=1 Tax=Roseimaritima sediminicola TaxID=2662066 RepID=UPI00129848F6|nr:prenyltransferase/squalene oxidase repeat-containing protein [Roseimaritima sediminicola]